MGPEERSSNADLKGPPSPEEAERKVAELGRDARRFSYFRLIYLLERIFAGTPAAGHTGPAPDERIRLRPDPSLSFASSDVSALDWVRFPDGQSRAQITATFLGLYGSVSPLPAYFYENIALSTYQGTPQPVRELLDVIHHRLFTLLYRTWGKYRLGVGYMRAGKDKFTRRMFCAVGLDGFSEHETPLHPFYFLRFAPLLASKSRSARGLEVVLHELLGEIGVAVEQFVGKWTLIEKPLRNKLGLANHQLGESLVIGKWVYDGGGAFQIKLGPLEYDDYLSFLPGGHRRPFLQAIVNTMTPGIHDVMLKLEVDLDAAPRWSLGSPRASTVARTMWLGGSVGQSFSITVPLEDKKTDDEGDDDDRGEPPPPP
jgi:type VI secretion system protein ImpH